MTDLPIANAIPYEEMASTAMRTMLRPLLELASAPGGLVEPHHFYITFDPGFAGVVFPSEIAARNPASQTIILQHRYFDLVAEESQFSVTLSFGARPARITIPYEAVTRFYDPSAQFAMQLGEGGSVVAAGRDPEPPVSAPFGGLRLVGPDGCAA